MNPHQSRTSITLFSAAALSVLMAVAVGVATTVTAAAAAEPVAVCADRVRAEVRTQLDGGMPREQADLLLQTRLARECLGDAQAPPSNATAFFIGTLNREYHRLAHMFISHALDSSSYLGLVRDRSAKSKRARNQKNYVVWFGQGDQDSDFVPDRLDTCPGTPPATVTTPNGCPDPVHGRPRAPNDSDVRWALEQYKMPVNPACYDAPAPAAPQAIKLGYNNVDRTTFKLAIVPVPRQPVECPIYYEFNVTIQTPFVQNGLPIALYTGFAFQDTETIELGSARAVFQITAADAGDKKVVFDSFDILTGAHWRVRGVTGAGLAGPWTAIAFTTQPSFGEP
jgi:hypothetical protein